MKQKSVCVIGGGAAGMMAAITAAREGAKVTILEAGDRLGKKILVTGNGRCNLGNLMLDIGCYHGSCRFLREALASFGTRETISFFEGLGLMIKDKNGYLYPFCEQASAVLDVLRHEIKELGIQVEYDFKVSGVTPKEKQGFRVKSEHGSMEFDHVIITCGGKASPKTGSDGSGYEIARKLGHRVTEVLPALTYLKCKESFFKSIAGVRTDAVITLYKKDGEMLCEERGELQLTEQGISGIPTFQLSSFAARSLLRIKEIPASIDFLPDVQETEIKELAQKRLFLCGERSIEEFFTGILNKKVMAVLLKTAGLKPADSSKTLTEKRIAEVIWLAKSFRVTVVGTGDFQNCQVCSGGVDCGQITQTMESKLVRGIYFAGEILDVDGRCGGYNLQWAWTSGHIAGISAAGRREEQ